MSWDVVREGGNLRSNGSPADETPMLLDTSAQGDLLANVGAGRAGQDQLGGVVLDGGYLGARRGGTNVDHNDLVLGQLGDLGLLAVGGSHTEQATEQVEVHLNLTVDLGEASLEAQDETDETIGSAESWVDASTDTNETTGDGVLEVVRLGVERNHTREDGRALKSTAIVSGNDTGSDLDLIAQLDDTVQDGTTSNTSLEVINLGTRLVDVE